MPSLAAKVLVLPDKPPFSLMSCSFCSLPAGLDAAVILQGLTSVLGAHIQLILVDLRILRYLEHNSKLSWTKSSTMFRSTWAK